MLRRLLSRVLERIDGWFDVDLTELDDDVFPPRLDTP